MMDNLTVEIKTQSGVSYIIKPLKEFYSFQQFADYLKAVNFESVKAVGHEPLLVENELMFEWVNAYFIAFYSNFTESDITAFRLFTSYIAEHGKLSTRTSLMKKFLEVYKGQFDSKEEFAAREALYEGIHDIVDMTRYSTELFTNGYVMLGDGFIFERFEQY